ncbi:hyphally regulated cell wall protein 3-like isoform X2 [Hibiscus syriacus]|uniref:Hyphally regulated cell wall protein 3-like isoform X2 n=1 Tax=Hibiscus syriacus TaxID=106335 RepID=A0A6A3AXD1_HIBSY|nr:hyphally regulated cell wall protein 3-like isoform X2 [Hibiscus syriacus]
MSGGGFRVSSIPNSVRKTIQNIKEITGNHSEDEIYAVLKECSMDPNETAQRLLLQDPFREVKRKRDRKKENLNNKESAESRWRPGSQGRGTRGGRGNFPPRYAAETVVSKSSGLGRDNGMNQVAEKGSDQSLSTLQETKPKESTQIASPVSAMANGPTGVVAETFSAPARKAANPPQENSSVGNSEYRGAPSPVDAINKPGIAFGSGDMSGQPAEGSSDCFMSTAPTSSSAICFSSSEPELVPSNFPQLLGTSDTIKGENNQASTEPNTVIPTENKLAHFSSSEPALVPSNVSCLFGSLDTIKNEIGNNRASTERNAVIPTESKLASAATEPGTSFLQGKMPSKSSAVVKHPLGESFHPSSTATHGSSATRPSSNYNGRSQQIIDPQKVGSNKEWKPKPVTSNVGLGAGMAGASEVPTGSLETVAQLSPVSNVLNSEVDTSKLQKKLEELHLPQRQHVIIPNHIHVPESERTKLSFGSFDASFGVALNYVGGQESDKCSTPLSEASQDVNETAEEHGSSNQNALDTAEEGDCTDRPQSPTHAPGNLSGDGDVASIPENNENKQENALLSGSHQHSAVTSPSYSFGIVPPMLAPFGNAESQAREVPRLSSFVVPQPFDPAAYYAQFYRSSADPDGRVSPFASGVATKYNGNVAVLPPQTSQSPQEGGNSLVLTTTSSSPIVTQAAGMMQSSMAVTQQPVPVYRSAAGAGTVYPSAPAAPTTGVKFSLPQFKPRSNTPNSAHIGMPSGYGPYGSSPAGYNPSSAATTGNSTTNEDLGAAQFKENNVYASGQQSEGSAVWISPPGRDISNLPASSFYNLAPPGQNVTFAPTQVVPGSFAGIYHPQAETAAAVHPLLQRAQTMAGAVNMGGSAAGVYRQPQHAQMNWPSNY